MRNHTILATTCAGMIIALAPAVHSAVTVESDGSIITSHYSDETVEGMIKSVDTKRRRFILATENDKELTVYIVDKTKYFLDGEEATRDEALKARRKATVTHEALVAKKVEVSSK